MIRVGTAGWSYPDWEGRVYPRSKPHGFHPLRFLAAFVDCVEINSTFYAQPREQHAQRWAELVTEQGDFRFIVKLLQQFTHEAEPDDEGAWEDSAGAFLRGIAPLERARRLAAILVQFPASFQHGATGVRRLRRLRSLLGDRPAVVELRHESWFRPPALDAVRGSGFSLAYVDLPAAWNHPPFWHAPTGPIGYLRLHGRNKQWFRRGAPRDDRYDYLYAPDEVRELAAKARRIESVSDQAFVVTNNHFAGQALANAIELRSIFAHEPVPAPADLLRAFPRLATCARATGQGELFS